MFIPHKHMCINDHYSIINYKSDSALTFAHYILSNNLLEDKKIILGVSESNDIELYSKFVNDRYPHREVGFVCSFCLTGSKWAQIKKYFILYKMIATSSHVFTSQTPIYRPLAQSSKICMINLGYYVAPIKDSTHDKKSKLYINYQSIDDRDYDYYMVTSEVSKRIIMATYGLRYDQFKILGMCRNDYLFSSEQPESLKSQLLRETPYEVKKIVLYTPTHRDNLTNIKQFDFANYLFGFNIDLDNMDTYLRTNNMYLVCKVHPKQLSFFKGRDFPASIGLFNANNTYGLAELMKISDVLITDYTSGYFDFLILDRPIIFNLYDIDRYKETRGLIFDPIEPICAGEIIHNENELFMALSNIDVNRELYKEKRKQIRDMFHFYQDTYSCKRVYDYFFNKLALS